MMELEHLKRLVSKGTALGKVEREASPTFLSSHIYLTSFS
jgi:hypothetical protein